MRSKHKTAVVLAAGLLALALARMQARAQDPAGAGQGRQRGGFGAGGGQPVQGTVTAAGAGKVTIQTAAGDSYTVTATDTTRVTKDRQPIKLGDIKVGDGLTAMGTVDASAKTVQAMMLMDVDAETVKKAKEEMGKSYLTGKITAIDADNLKLTVLRTDSVSQVIQVDEGTSFQKGARGITVPSAFGGGMGMGGGRGGMGGGNGAAPPPAPESITLADIKVGDTVVATGGLKNGVFFPAKMGVSEPGAAGGGRRRGGPGGADAGAPPNVPGSAPAAAPPQ